MNKRYFILASTTNVHPIHLAAEIPLKSFFNYSDVIRAENRFNLVVVCLATLTPSFFCSTPRPNLNLRASQLFAHQLTHFLSLYYEFSHINIDFRLLRVRICLLLFNLAVLRHIGEANMSTMAMKTNF